jgi:hypothetical protein
MYVHISNSQPCDESALPSDDGIGSDWVTELTQEHIQKLTVETINIALAHLLVSCELTSEGSISGDIFHHRFSGFLCFMLPICAIDDFCMTFIYITLSVLYFITKNEYLSVSTVYIHRVFSS